MSESLKKIGLIIGTILTGILSYFSLVLRYGVE